MKHAEDVMKYVSENTPDRLKLDSCRSRMPPGLVVTRMGTSPSEGAESFLPAFGHRGNITRVRSPIHPAQSLAQNMCQKVRKMSRFTTKTVSVMDFWSLILDTFTRYTGQ